MSGFWRQLIYIDESNRHESCLEGFDVVGSLIISKHMWKYICMHCNKSHERDEDAIE